MISEQAVASSMRVYSWEFSYDLSHEATTDQSRNVRILLQGFGNVDGAFRADTVVLKVKLHHRTVYLQ